MVEWAHQEARGEEEGRSAGESEGSRDGGGVLGVSGYEGRRGKGRRREGLGRGGVRREGMHRYQINRINRHGPTMGQSERSGQGQNICI